MKQCTNYDEAMHYDCKECTEEDCVYDKRKINRSNNAFYIFALIIILFIIFLIL